MLNELIRAELEKASAEYIKHKSSKIPDDKAFSYNSALCIIWGQRFG